MASAPTTVPVDAAAASAFLHAGRLAVVGASDARDSFGRSVLEELRSHGIDAVPVHPSATTVAGVPACARLADVPPPVAGAIVMVAAPASVDVVREVAACGIPRVWLFKGIGGAGANSPEAVATAHELGLDGVPGACPLMFLEPAAWVHRLHRSVRHLRHAVA